MFGGFGRRLTRGYVFLAVVLIVAVAAASTALSFLLYVRTLNESLTTAGQRATQEINEALQRHESLAQAAPAVAKDVGRGRFRVTIFDNQRRSLGESEPREQPSAQGRTTRMLGLMIGLPRARIPVKGGMIFIDPDLDRFGQILLWYWSIMIPVGLFAILVAWLIGRRITARAVIPLAEVTKALRTIAGGDFTPQPLLGNETDFLELTSAYNDVAYRLTTATAQRQQSDAQMRQFIADAGHELRTPLTVIMGYIDMLGKGAIADSSAAQRIYETMLEQSRRMRTLIEKLIFLARLDRPIAQEFGTVDVSNVVSRAVDALEPIANGRLRTQPAPPSVVRGDEAEIYEAVRNVLDNAIKYAPESPVRVSVGQVDGSVQVAVKDEGPGMDSQDVAHAFDRFYRGSARGEIEGSGLGLAIAKRAVERAGGTIRIDSARGKGTAVLLDFPRDLSI